MTYFKLPDHVCPITGMKLYGKGAGTEQEKKKKRERYHKQKEQGKVVTMYAEACMTLSLRDNCHFFQHHTVKKRQLIEKV